MFKSSFSKKFVKAYAKLPLFVQKKFDKQLELLIQDLRHPSIHAKKKHGEKDIWEGRVDRFYRFTFTIEAENIILRTIGPHDQALE